MCGESRTHSLEGVVEGRPSTTTLQKVAIGSCPTWSPDGAEIAFVSGGREQKHISILSLGTRKQKVIFPPKAPPSCDSRTCGLVSKG